MRSRRDAGESLIETVLSILIVSMTVTALVSSLATAGSAGTAQRNSVKADIVMRNYAEAIKAATRACVDGGTYTIDFEPPTGFSVAASPSGGSCPSVEAPQLLVLAVTSHPSETTTTMHVNVRTP